MRDVDFEIWLDRWVDNQEPPLDEVDCHAGEEDGCSCPNCLREGREYITEEFDE